MVNSGNHDDASRLDCGKEKEGQLINGGAQDRAIVLAWMQKASSYYPHDYWFTAAYLCRNLHFNKQQMYRILNYLFSQGRIERMTHLGCAHRWKVVRESFTCEV